MTGRLGMTQNALGRGDGEVWKGWRRDAASMAVGGAAMGAGMAGVNHVIGYPERRRRRKAMAAQYQQTMSKSFIPGKGFVSASEVPLDQLRSLAHGGRLKAAKKATKLARKESKKYKKINNAISQAHQQLGEPTAGFDLERFDRKPDIGRAKHVSTTPVHEVTGTRAALGLDAGGAAAFHHGGRRGGRLVVSTPQTSAHAIAHEATHVQPKRSGYRVHSMNPMQTAREEAHADMNSGTKATHYKTNLVSQMRGGGSMYSMSAKSKIFRGMARRSQGDDPQYKTMFSNEGAKAYRQVQDKIAASRSRKMTEGSKRGTKRRFGKADITMSDAEAKRISDKHGTVGPLPKSLKRPERMKAYEARYVTTGGHRAEKWKRRATGSEAVRNIGLGGATGSAAVLLATRHPKAIPYIARTKGLRVLKPHRVEAAALSSAVVGGASEIYGEHSRAMRSKYTSAPAGVAGSALTRMQQYTKPKPGANP